MEKQNINARKIKKNFIQEINSFKRSEETKELTFMEFISLHENSSTVFLALVVAVLCLIPIPGTGTVFGWFLLLLSFCFLFSYSINIPSKIKNLKISKKLSYQTLLIFFKIWNFIDKKSDNRIDFLFDKKFKPLWFLLWIVMSILIILPIPFGNTIPAFTLIIFFISWIVKDGLLLMTIPIMACLSFIPAYLSLEVITKIIQLA